MNTYHYEIFDIVKTHLLKQGQRATVNNDEDNHCLYHSPNGLKCAVGCLITDEAYDSDIEGDDIGEATVKRALQDSQIDTSAQTVSFLTRLQHVHDNLNVDEWPEALDEIEEELLL